MANTPTETLRQIVGDMYGLSHMEIGHYDGYEVSRIAEAVRALAEAVLSLHTPVSDPDVTGSGIRTVTQKGRA